MVFGVMIAQCRRGRVAIDVTPFPCWSRRPDRTPRSPPGCVLPKPGAGRCSDQPNGTEGASQNALGAPKTQPMDIRYLVGCLLLESPLFADSRGRAGPHAAFLRLAGLGIYHGLGFRHRPFPCRQFFCRLLRPSRVSSLRSSALATGLAGGERCCEAESRMWPSLSHRSASPLRPGPGALHASFGRA